MSKGPRNITIQKVSYRDLGTLGKIFASTFGDEVHPGHIKQRIRRIRQFYHLLRPLARLSPWVKNLFNIYVIKAGGDVAGFIQLSRLNNSQLHLDYIAIKKQYRGQGLGTWVLRKLTAEVAEPEKMELVLEVKSDNPAHRLYRELGFATQARILHFEKTLGAGGVTVAAQRIAGLRPLRDADRRQLPEVYRHSVADRLLRVLSRDPNHYNPSLLTRHLEWLKNRLMRSTRREYAVERDGQIVAALEISSYPKVENHMVSLLLRQDYEQLRAALLQYALFTLYKRYGHGLVTTTIYDDNPRKPKTLARLGFTHTATYYLMVRPAKPVKSQPLPAPRVVPLAEERLNKTANIYW
jgi:ribosomal protein S18 acetylase RimI-like enzyme